jgi:hypothetical protein
MSAPIRRQTVLRQQSSGCLRPAQKPSPLLLSTIMGLGADVIGPVLSFFK